MRGAKRGGREFREICDGARSLHPLDGILAPIPQHIRAGREDDRTALWIRTILVRELRSSFGTTRFDEDAEMSERALRRRRGDRIRELSQRRSTAAATVTRAACQLSREITFQSRASRVPTCRVRERSWKQESAIFSVGQNTTAQWPARNIQRRRHFECLRHCACYIYIKYTYMSIYIILFLIYAIACNINDFLATRK